MLIIGLLLILLAAAVVAYMLLATAGSPDVSIDYGVLNLEIPPLWLYLAGLATLAVAALGFWMVGAGARAKARRSREVRELRKQAKESDRRAVRSDDASSLNRPGTRPTTSGSTGTPTSGTTRSPGTSSGTSAPTDRSRLDLDR
ncbi:MAG TPA: hypothetical protein VLO09_09155 [Ornithinimicrobium sp.]|nr:hypothetical protein [Ornithinimicrobium sp.]